MPDKWHCSTVTSIFKKGDPADCTNYRPISLLHIGYKLFAQILLARLQRAGVDNYLWGTQFGFRKGRGTGDALFVLHHLLEQTCAKSKGRLVLLALD